MCVCVCVSPPGSYNVCTKTTDSVYTALSVLHFSHVNGHKLKESITRLFSFSSDFSLRLLQCSDGYHVAVRIEPSGTKKMKISLFLRVLRLTRPWNWGLSWRTWRCTAVHVQHHILNGCYETEECGYPSHYEKTLRLRIFNACVKSVLLYGCESWLVTKGIQRKIQTFVNRCLRYILRIWWPNIISNKDLRKVIGQEDINMESIYHV